MKVTLTLSLLFAMLFFAAVCDLCLGYTTDRYGMTRVSRIEQPIAFWLIVAAKSFGALWTLYLIIIFRRK